MSEKTYNGWSNYETWNVKLWIDNEEHSQRYWEDQADDALRSGFGDDETNDGAINRLAEQLETEFTEGAPEMEGTYSDLLNAALSEVDWYEIAKSMINDAKERIAA